MLLQSLKAGKITSAYGEEFSFSDGDIQNIANSYNPAQFCARLYREHGDEDLGKAPVGTVRLALAQGGNLWVVPEKVAPDFEAEVKARERHSISVRLFRPGEKGEGWRLRHVAFPKVPACEGMAPPEFSGEVKPALFEFPIDLPAEFAQQPTPPNPMTKTTPPVDFEAEATALRQENERLKQQAVDFAQAQKTSHDQKAVDFAAGLCTAGKLKPALKDRLVQVLQKLPLGAVDFAAGDNTTKQATLLDELSDIISEALPQDARFEKSTLTGTPVPPGQAPTVDFAAPVGTAADPDSLALHGKALTYCQARSLDPDQGNNYLNAVAAVS